MLKQSLIEHYTVRSKSDRDLKATTRRETKLVNSLQQKVLEEIQKKMKYSLPYLTCENFCCGIQSSQLSPVFLFSKSRSQ